MRTMASSMRRRGVTRPVVPWSRRRRSTRVPELLDAYSNSLRLRVVRRERHEPLVVFDRLRDVTEPDVDLAACEVRHGVAFVQLERLREVAERQGDEALLEVPDPAVRPSAVEQ